MAVIEIEGDRFLLFDDAGAPKDLLLTFVSGVEFFSTQETELTLEAVLSGTAMDNCILQLEQSFDDGTTWTVVPDVPIDLETLVGTIPNHNPSIVLQPECSYRFSAKREGGGIASALLMRGSRRLLQGIHRANKDNPAYDPATGTIKVTVTDQPVEVEGPVADDVAATASPPVKQGGVALDVLDSVTTGKIVHAVHDLYRRKWVRDATYDSLQDANSVNVKNAPQFHYKYQTVAEVTSGGTGTYDYYVDMTTYKKSALHFILGTTATFVVKLYAIIQGDGTVPAACQEIDITEETIFVPSFGVTTVIIDNIEKLAALHYVHIEVVTTVAADNWTIFLNKLH